MSTKPAMSPPEVAMVNPARIVVVCPTLERQDLVRQMVNSLQATAKAAAKDSAAAALCLREISIVLVASGPDDGTARWARAKKLGVIESPDPLPFAKAVNLGAKAAGAAIPHEWLLIVNNDIVFQPGFWQAFAQMAGWGAADVLGAKLLYPPDHPQHAGKVQHAGKMFTLDGYPFHVLRFQSPDHEKLIVPRSYPGVTFACVAIKRRLWDELGGLDEQYVNGFEDDDWCLRAREIGAQIGVHPGMLAWHMESQTSGHDTANKEAQWQRFHAQWVESGRIQWALGVWQGWRS